MKKKLVLTICMLAMGASLLTGCKKEETPVPTETQKVTEVKEDKHQGLEQNALNGTWQDPATAQKRPMAIMVENTKVTLPQYGISCADIVYELPVEGGITRLMTIAQDYGDLERVGNVRSCRIDFLFFAKEYDAVYYHCGQNYLAEDLLNAGFVADVNGITGTAGAYFYRSDEAGRKAPHNLYTSSALLQQAMTDMGFDTPIADVAKEHFLFAEEDELNTLDKGDKVVRMDIYYANNEPYFIYDDKSKTYLRYQFDEEQIEGNTNEQLSYTNVILQSIPIDFDGNGVVLMNTVAEGTGKFFTQGKAIDITWKKESDTAPTKYYDTQGNEITLNPGKTWICVQKDTDMEKNVFSDKADAEE